MQEIKSIQDFTNTTQDSLNKGKLVVINFLAEWAAECGQVNDVLEELSKQLPHVVFLKVEAEKVQDLSEKFRIEVVPTCVLYKNGAEVARVEGANAPELSSKVKQHSIQAPPLPTGGDPKEALNQRLKQIINQARIMLFMKGSPQEPRCGFSRQIVGLLNETGVEYGSFDILSDEEVRQGLKEFSNWPTYPQVYVKGELIGGLDIVREMKESGELEESLNA